MSQNYFSGLVTILCLVNIQNLFLLVIERKLKINKFYE